MMNLDIFNQYPFLEASRKFFESLNILLHAYTDVPLTAKEALQKKYQPENYDLIAWYVISE